MNKRFSNASSRDCAPEDDDETAAMVVTSENEQMGEGEEEEEEEEEKRISRGGSTQHQQQLKKRTSKNGEEGEELIQQEDDLQSLGSQSENFRADPCLDHAPKQQQQNGTFADESCDQQEEKLKLIELQEQETAPLVAKVVRSRPTQLHIHTVNQPAEKVKSPPPNASAADEPFLRQMREKKKVAGLIARFNAFAPTAAGNNENGGGACSAKKVGVAEHGKMDELRQKFS